MDSSKYQTFAVPRQSRGISHFWLKYKGILKTTFKIESLHLTFIIVSCINRPSFFLYRLSSEQEFGYLQYYYDDHDPQYFFVSPFL